MDEKDGDEVGCKRSGDWGKRWKNLIPSLSSQLPSCWASLWLALSLGGEKQHIRQALYSTTQAGPTSAQMLSHSLNELFTLG